VHVPDEKADSVPPVTSSDQAIALWRALRDEVRRNSPRGRILIAVDGEDGSGKTRFADHLAAVFAEDGTRVLRASIDDFHRSRSERYRRGRTSPEGFYLDSYDYDAFRRLLVEPFRTGAADGVRLAAFDLAADRPVDAPSVSVPDDALLIVDGIFLNRPELRGIWHWSVWLDAPLDVRYARMAERDGCDADPAADSNRRYREGQELYLKEAAPRTAASVIVDNTDPASPRRVYADFC
jgi:uridine kinase